MTRPTRIAIAALSVACGLLIVALVWALTRGDDGYAKLEQDNAKLVIQVGKLQVERDEALKVIAEAKAKAKAREVVIESQAAEVARLKRKLRTPPPEAKPWTQERDEVIAAQDLQIDSQALQIKTCWTAEEGCQTALEKQVAITLIERERADNCMTFTRKNKKRERWKLAGVAIGSLGAGAGIGYGVAQLP